MKLGSWNCDNCGQIIECAKDGWLEWLSCDSTKNIEQKSFGLRLVHDKPSSPRNNTENGCQYNGQIEHQNHNAGVMDISLEECLGNEGLLNLLEMIDKKELPIEEVSEMIKRLHVSNYEQARGSFELAIHQGLFEPNDKPGIYTQRQIDIVAQWVERKQK